MNTGEVIVPNVKVLGTGCANCKATVKLIEEVARARGAAVTVEKVEEIRDIMSYGVMSTPGVVIDGNGRARRGDSRACQGGELVR